MRHGTASMTLDVYAGLWPDADDRAVGGERLCEAARCCCGRLLTTTSQAVR